MIQIKNTPRNAGVAISGDLMDLEELYDMLYLIVGEEGEDPLMSSSRMRVLGFCYDLRHAIMGEREYEFVDNGLEADMMRRLSLISSDKTVYMSFRTYWPEILFINAALDIFIADYAKKQKHPNWDRAISTIRSFQSRFIDCLRQVIPESNFSRILNVMGARYYHVDKYITQYVDVLNCRFLAMDAEKRLKNISVMVKRIYEKGQEYQECRDSILAAASEHRCSPEELSIDLEYPDVEELGW